MFSPRELDLERGWPGRIDGDRVVQLAAQTLQAFFTGGGQAREHAEYALDDVVLRAPVLHPPSVRIYTDTALKFANPSSIYGPEATIPYPAGAKQLQLELALAAVIGAEGAIGGFTIMNDWTAPDLGPVKEKDFATSLGPVVVTPDEFDGARASFVVRVDGDAVDSGALHPGDWPELVSYAARNTRLLPGDVIAVGGTERFGVRRRETVELEVKGIGVLHNLVGELPA
jgi:2-keto-4-pentenoate hydratase/2-oxohepta-3-ene-1,7-dioic acid hydratase in catechol pathway